MSSVSQSNVSKYSLTAHIGGDLEDFLCLDIEDSEDNGLDRRLRDTLPAKGGERDRQLPKPQIPQIWRNTRRRFDPRRRTSICACRGFASDPLKTHLKPKTMQSTEELISSDALVLCRLYRVLMKDAR